MRAFLSKAEIQSEISERIDTAFKLHERLPTEILSAGIAEVDCLTSGLPRGAITEVFGTSSSGRTSVMLSVLAHATNAQEVCALVDASNAFDPASAAGARMVFDRLLWVRCAADGEVHLSEGKRIERAFKAADLLLQSGGFGVVALDLSDISARDVRRIISSWWFRFRRAIENTSTVLIVAAAVSCVGSRASQALEVMKENVSWTSASDTLSPAQYQTRRSDSVISLYPPAADRARKLMKTATPSLVATKFRKEFLLNGLELNVERQKPISLRPRKAHLIATARP
jgi:hypothetical protein